MPFAKEHSARQADPSQYREFRRNHPSGWPAGVDAVFGLRPGGPAEIQSIRFDKGKFSVDKAKAWLKENGYKVGSFEPATKGWTSQFQITKVVEDERLVFGWGYVTRDPTNKLVSNERTLADGTVVDHSGEVIDILDLEKAIYSYVEDSREGDVMHTEKVTATLVESMVFTPQKKHLLGLPDDFPEGVVLGFRVNDDEAWKRIRSGELKMLSLAGGCTREQL